MMNTSGIMIIGTMNSSFVVEPTSAVMVYETENMKWLRDNLKVVLLVIGEIFSFAWTSILIVTHASIADTIIRSFALFTIIPFGPIADNYTGLTYFPVYRTIGANWFDIDKITIGKRIGSLFPSNL
jgi:hypothetical protein